MAVAPVLVLALGLLLIGPLITVANLGHDAASSPHAAAKVSPGTETRVPVDSFSSRLPPLRPLTTGAPGVVATVVLPNASVIPGNYLAGNGLDPGAVAYVPALGEIFVSDLGSGNVSVINDSTDRVVAAVPVPSPCGLAYDNASGELFVASLWSGLYVINTTSDAVGARIPLGFSSSASGGVPSVVYDSGTDQIFVSNYNWQGNVSVVSAANDSVVAVVNVSSYPDGLAYDPAQHEVFVVAESGQDVQAISDANDTIVATALGVIDPGDVAYDAGTGQLFVTQLYTQQVAVLSAATLDWVTNVSVGQGSYGVAYDPTAGRVFVSDAPSSTGTDAFPAGDLSAINDQTDRVAFRVPVGLAPQGVAFDSGRGEAIVADSGSDELSVVANATASLVATIPVGATPWAVTFDPSVGDAFVTSELDPQYGGWPANEVVALNGTTGDVLANISVGNWAMAIAYGGDSEVLVADLATGQGTGEITILNDSTDSVVRTYAPGSGEYPVGLAYDSGKNAVFAAIQGANGGSNEVQVLQDGTATATIPVRSQPQGVAYDPSRGEIFVTLPWAGAVDVINDTHDTIVATVTVGGFPYCAAYANGTGEVYVGNTGVDNVSVIDDTNNSVVANLTYVTPNRQSSIWGIADDAVNGVMYVTSAAGGVTAISTANRKILGTAATGLESIGVAVDPVTGDAYVANAGQGTVSILGPQLNGTGAYGVNFTERGLPNGTRWSVTLAGFSASSNRSVISFSEPNGTYPYSLGTVPGFQVQPTGGNLTVSGSAVSVSIAFNATRYLLTFQASGLPSGTSWSVVLNGSRQNGTGATLGFRVPDGSYQYSASAAGFRATPPTGTVTVNGNGPPVVVPFQTRVYGLTFNETGLPNGTSWGILIGNQSQTSLGPSLTVLEPNGSYSFVVLTVPGYVPVYSGPAVVQGANTTVAVSFHLQTYPIVFVEFGLPSGTNWSVTVANNSTGFHQSKNTTSNAITFFLPNGTYNVSFGLPVGYRGNVSSTQITVDGKPATAASLTVGPVPASAPGGPRTQSFPVVDWVVGGGGVAVLAASLYLVARARRRIPPGGPSPP